MFTEESLFQVLDSAIKDISHRVVKIDIVNVPEGRKAPGLHPCNVWTKTKGDYEMTFVLCTDYEVLEKMTSNMKRGAEAKEEDVAVYMQEFLNILCGHFVSRIHELRKLKVFFEVPCFVKGEYQELKTDKKEKIRGNYYYDSPYGSLELKVIYN